MRGTSYPTASSSYATTQSSSLCGDTSAVSVAPQRRAQVGASRGRGRKRDNARGVPFVSARKDSSSSQLPSLSGHKRAYSSVGFAAANGRNSKPTTGFGVYSNPATGTQVLN
ncbi:hypothetical protein K7X08_037943 [Anisodus acutangulus]|uniref:Uncharacterized protein n=1 Tax=Anisodus acutangulus TaxID=402998 RepID=A0A9Q1RSH8_9SOLA|nr:hypothetical protein K7X08_037943 [Anisodus acutangulus]